MESEKCHLSGIIIRDLSSVVSNYRSSKTLDEYLKEQGVLGEPPHQCDIAHSTCRPGAHVYATSLKSKMMMPLHTMLEATSKRSLQQVSTKNAATAP